MLHKNPLIVFKIKMLYFNMTRIIKHIYYILGRNAGKWLEITLKFGGMRKFFWRDPKIFNTLNFFHEKKQKLLTLLYSLTGRKRSFAIVEPNAIIEPSRASPIVEPNSSPSSSSWTTLVTSSNPAELHPNAIIEPSRASPQRHVEPNKSSPSSNPAALP